MIGAILDRVDKYLGRGRHSIAVPVMDGPLYPNTLLEDAELAFDLVDVDNLTSVGKTVYASSGEKLISWSGGAVDDVTSFDAPITCIAAAPNGTLAIGLDGHGIILRGGSHDGKQISAVNGTVLTGVTAAAFANDTTLYVTIGAKERLCADWKRDLMAHGKAGEVWKIDIATGNGTSIASGLKYPYGICTTANGVAVSEAWAHRVVHINDSGQNTVLVKDIPGYPARITPDGTGGYALAIFAPRNQLVEFVLREPEFLNAMTTQVHPNNWIAPKLKWGEGFKEPMQGAALKTMGIIKPWAPTWSYGLVVQLDQDFTPIASFHSRADGQRHGVTSVAALDGHILAAAKGTGVVAKLTPQKETH